jgi:dihydrofolate reductase
MNARERGKDMKVVAAEYVSVDGVMEDPAWTGPFWNDELGKAQYDLLFASDALLLGRVTYQGFAAAWPIMEGTGEFGERMNTMPKYVASRTLTETEWNATLIEDDVPEAVSRLKQQPGGNLLIYGSAALVNSLLPHVLIDEYRLMLHPVIVGKGKRLFNDGMDTTGLKLVDTKTTATGVTILTYQPAVKDAEV